MNLSVELFANPLRQKARRRGGQLLSLAAIAAICLAAGWAQNGERANQAPSRPKLPGGNYQPFSKKSPFNIAIPANPQLDQNSASIVSTLLGMTQDSLGILRTAAQPNNIDYTFPFYFSEPSDPAYTIKCHFDGPPPNWGHCPLQGMQIHIPAYARRENSDNGPHPWSSDHHFAIVDPTTHTEFDMWGASQPNGEGGALLIGWGGMGSRSGLGINTFGATQSQFALTNGMVRAADLKGGTFLTHCRWQFPVRAVRACIRRQWARISLVPRAPLRHPTTECACSLI